MTSLLLYIVDFQRLDIRENFTPPERPERPKALEDWSVSPGRKMSYRHTPKLAMKEESGGKIHV